ncbi:MAG: amylo-alpha-1,6-glucosidase, partial [Minicystis sp.]
TWMDARARGAPVTSRAGCPVELSALWSRGCETLSRLARAAGDTALADRAQAECARTRAAFRARFWCAETGYPYDVISERPDGPGAFHDASLRPNAVMALAVDPACFSPEQAIELLDRAQVLVTRAGLRSLAPDHPSYAGRPEIGSLLMDNNVHQGAVWPFLLGFFVRAARRCAAEAHLGPFLQRLVASTAANEAALGQLPELAGGDAPHAPAGCIAQASSVAELLRAVAWDLA